MTFPTALNLAVSDRAARNRAYAEMFVRWLTAIVFLVAATLKANQIATEPMHGNGILSSLPLAIVQVEFETVLGTLLLAGIWARVIRYLTLGTLAVFLGFSAYKTWGGAASCGCFGKVEVDPRITMVMDLVLIACLHVPNCNRSESCSISRKQILIVTIGLLGCAGLLPKMLGLRPLAMILQPDIIADSNVFDFGIRKVSDGLQFEHDFKIENRGKKSVRILNSTSSCRCTVADFPKEPIPPGGSIFIHINANWDGKFGQQREQVMLVTDGSVRQTIALTLSAKIVSAAVFYPQIIDFGDVIEGQSANRAVTVAPGAGQERLEVVSATAADGSLKLSEEHSSEDGEYRWNIELAGIKVQNHVRTTAQIMLHSSDTSNFALDVPITYSIVPAIRVSPQSLVFDSKQEDIVKLITVNSKTKIDSISVSSENIDSKAFRVETKSSMEVADGWRYLVEVTFLPEVSTSKGNASIIFRGGTFSNRVTIVLVPK